LINRLSDNVGAVNCFLSTQRHPLLRKRHFALVEKPLSQPGRIIHNANQTAAFSAACLSIFCGRMSETNIVSVSIYWRFPGALRVFEIRRA
jgi:hypothetical protein